MNKKILALILVLLTLFTLVAEVSSYTLTLIAIKKAEPLQYFISATAQNGYVIQNSPTEITISSDKPRDVNARISLTQSPTNFVGSTNVSISFIKLVNEKIVRENVALEPHLISLPGIKSDFCQDNNLIDFSFNYSGKTFKGYCEVAYIDAILPITENSCYFISMVYTTN